MTKVLVITIGSNRKLKPDQILEYQSAWRLSDFLSEELTHKLYNARRRIRDLIMSDYVSRDGVLLRSMPFNAHIVDGPDFEGKEQRGLYLPALQLFNGRFYKELGTVAERASLAKHINNHLLIVNPLYGLLTPTELIQCHSCNITDHPRIAKYWTENDLLSHAIIVYIERHGITKVIDLMAVDAYRNLISWEMIRHATKGNVLHSFSRQFAGAALLPSLGQLARELLKAPEASLIGIKAGDSKKITVDEIVFQPLPIPSNPDIPHEIKIQQIRLTAADKIGRMHRNLLLILQEIPGLQPDEDSFGAYVRELRRRIGKDNRNMADLISKLNRSRNMVEHEGYVIEDAELDNLTVIYNEVEQWACNNKYVSREILEQVKSV